MDFMRSIYEMPGLLYTLGKYSAVILIIFSVAILIANQFSFREDE